VLERLVQSGAQVFLTGTEIPRVVGELHVEPCVFHVEHGRVTLR